MASKTYTVIGLVLRKTKLSETDLIIDFLIQDGSSLHCVAKGARKPNSRFSSHLELFNCVEVLIAEGKSLDIITESRLISRNAKLHSDPIFGCAASIIAEAASKLTDSNLENPVIFDLTNAAFDTLEECNELSLANIICAYLIKGSAFVGFKPEFSNCLNCGTSLYPFTENSVAFSYIEGGISCAQCKSQFEYETLNTNMLNWAFLLLKSTFNDILSFEIPVDIQIDLLQFCKKWLFVHMGIKLKALEQFIILEYQQ